MLHADLVTLRDALAEALDYVDAHIAVGGLPHRFDANCSRLNQARDALKLVKFKGASSVQHEGADALAIGEAVKS